MTKTEYITVRLTECQATCLAALLSQTLFRGRGRGDAFSKLEQRYKDMNAAHVPARAIAGAFAVIEESIREAK